MPSCCIAYTSDTAYLLPTIASACQARNHASADIADVVIFAFGLAPFALDLATSICERERISLILVKTEVLQGAPAMLARLFLELYVPTEYTQFLYLDGDVQIRGCLDPLINRSVPPGRFLAANDPLTFQIGDRSSQSRDLARHLHSLGIGAAEACSYFNSGVLRICREGWNDIGASAWKQFRKMGKTTRFPDQDALNIVAWERRLPMSLTWNFPIFLRNSRLPRSIRPRVEHYMSNPKPWQGKFSPWTSEECEPYRCLLYRYPLLSSLCPQMSPTLKVLYSLHQQRKRAVETISWGFSARRARILEYESTCAI